MTVIVTNKSPLVVPPAISRRAGFKAGQKLEFKVTGKSVTIVPREPGNEYTPVQRRAIDRSIAQSEKEYAEGKNAGPFATAEEFLASMEADIRKLRTARRSAKSPRR